MTTRPVAFWIIVVFLVLSFIMLLLGQIMALIDYDSAAQLGLQESREAISEYGMQVNRGFAAGDTLVYATLTGASVIGLLLRKRWALLTTGAVMGISAYWPVVSVFMLIFLRGVPGYTLVPGLEMWLVMAIYFAFGVWGLFYLILRGDRLVSSPTI